jgi:glycosyltransferase involved in cell wall biosynthesis
MCHEVIVRDQSFSQSLSNSLGALATHKPLQSVYSWQPALMREFKERVKDGSSLENFDLVHVEHLRGSRYGVEIKTMFPELLVIWDSVDCISHLFEQTLARSTSLFGKLVSAIELKKTRHFEGELATLFDQVIITSQVDKNAMLDLVAGSNKPAPISVLSNGVDLEYFEPRMENFRDSETIVFSGKMSYHANISMVDYLVREIMPKVWKERPTARLVIVGKDPPFKIRKMARNPLITVTGTVLDIRPYLWGATVAVVPLVYGAGIQNKILEAMASGTPVVTNSRALSTLQAAVGKDVLVGDTPQEFADEILRLIKNKDTQRNIALAGAKYVQKNHDWNKIATELISIYESVLFEKRKLWKKVG